MSQDLKRLTIFLPPSLYHRCSRVAAERGLGGSKGVASYIRAAISEALDRHQVVSATTMLQASDNQLEVDAPDPGLKSVFDDWDDAD